MAPTNVSSKGKAKPGSKPSATPRSRNTTPLPNVRSSAEPSSSSSYFNKPLSSYLKRCEITLEEILDAGGSSTSIPSGSKLLAMRDKIESTVLKNVETRCTHSESVLRELQSMRKNRGPREREKDKDTEDRERKKLKKVAKKHDEDGKHPPTTGAHGVTRQDGVDVQKGTLHYGRNYTTSPSPLLLHGCLQNLPQPSIAVTHTPTTATAAQNP
jgi:transcriptional adapter 3